MATCGNCHQTDQSIEHIRDCFKQRYVTLADTPVEPSKFAQSYAQSRDYAPMALAPHIPDSNYALDTPAGLHFYRVSTGKKGSKWENFQFVDRMIGHPGDWLYQPVKKGNRHAVLNLIAQDAKSAAVRFSREFTVCAVCGSPLSDPISRETGLGPICQKRFG